MRVCIRCDHPLEDGWRCSACGYAPETGPDGFLRFADPGTDEYDDDFFGLLAPLEQGSFWFRSRNALITWALRQHAPGADAFLEVGCGTGYVLRGIHDAFPAIRLTGAELFAGGLPFAHERVPTAELIQADAGALPYRDAFPAVGAFDVLEHIDDDRAALSGMRDTLAPGGALFLTVPQHRWLWSAADDVAGHKRRYTRRELTRTVRETGFAIERVTSFVTTLLPAMALSRLHRRRDDSYDVTAEFRATAGMSRLLEGLVGVDRALIRAGISLPAGGSLLLVARRR